MATSKEYSNILPAGKIDIPLTAYPFIFLIWLYRLLVSPLLGNNCRFHPSCSQYAGEALSKYGVLKGLWMAVIRLGKCHPWHPGGYDPVN